MVISSDGDDEDGKETRKVVEERLVRIQEIGEARKRVIGEKDTKKGLCFMYLGSDGADASN